ncbi:MAG: hypothetical protein A2133_05380 [Actinobacteria bacterium RBG_16_64_13]|nr:MAG: hypothetical protein A2133_05380 [Actinobacteria bacterium RBG_16_64_13]
MTSVTGPFEATFREGDYAIADAEYQKCDSCGRVYFTKEQLDCLQKKAAAAARAAQGLLTPQEIKAFRCQYELTQTDLESMLGVSAKSVVRWEKGTVFQNAALDKFLRVLIDNPDLVEELRPSRSKEHPVAKPARKVLPALEHERPPAKVTLGERRELAAAA